MRQGGITESTGPVFLLGRHVTPITVPSGCTIPNEMDRSSRSVSLLCDDDFTNPDPIRICNGPIWIMPVVVLLPMKHHHHVSILLD